MNLLDPKVLSKPVIDSNQKLISISTVIGKLELDHSVDLGYKNEFIAREEVVQRLLNAAESLPKGVVLSLKETYRPKEFQEFIFNRRVDRLSKLAENIDKSDIEIRKLTSQFIAPPEVAGHPTGGAVDVSLIDDKGNELDLGCKYDEDEEASQGRCFSFAENITDLVRKNRLLLFSCMNRAGFVNYPYEWWHWSYGDKYWAAVTEASHAIYEAIER